MIIKKNYQENVFFKNIKIVINFYKIIVNNLF